MLQESDKYTKQVAPEEANILLDHMIGKISNKVY